MAAITTPIDLFDNLAQLLFTPFVTTDRKRLDPLLEGEQHPLLARMEEMRHPVDNLPRKRARNKDAQLEEDEKENLLLFVQQVSADEAVKNCEDERKEQIETILRILRGLAAPAARPLPGHRGAPPKAARAKGAKKDQEKAGSDATSPTAEVSSEKKPRFTPLWVGLGTGVVTFAVLAYAPGVLASLHFMSPVSANPMMQAFLGAAALGLVAAVVAYLLMRSTTDKQKDGLTNPEKSGAKAADTQTGTAVGADTSVAGGAPAVAADDTQLSL